MSVDVLARFQSNRIRRLVLWHVVVVASFLLWRMIENMPATAALQGSTFSVHPVGRALGLVLVLASVAACVAIVIGTYLARREFVAWVLGATWIAALIQRDTLDAFDIVYVLTTLIAAAAAFATRRS